MLRELFNNKKFIFIFSFVVQFIFYYLFEITTITKEYILADIGIAPVFGLMFGPVGALGVAFATLIGELYSNMDVIGSFIDFGIVLLISLITYKLWYITFKKYKLKTPRFDSIFNIMKFLCVITVSSLVYWALINIAVYSYPNMVQIYPLTSNLTRVSYILNNFIFSIIFGLFFISLFNTLKIKFQVPKKRISRINIPQKYFLIVFALLMVYLTLTIIKVINNDFTDNIFFIATIITSILFYINSFEMDVKAELHNYSIIEQIILIYLVILDITFLINFGFFESLGLFNIQGLDPEFRFLISISVSTTLIILLSLLHIHYIEKIITNPIYGLIDSIKNYKKNRELSTGELEKYSQSKDDVGRLVKTFTKLSDNIKSNFTKIENVTAENERILTEFNVASTIQSNMLPKDFDAFSKDKAFEIYAYMKPSKEVGGDFYDYFQINENNLNFVIGDVSGKGMPATLFMVKTMHLIKNHCKFDDDLSKVMEDVNDLACRRNDENLFVTSWLGKLDLDNGKLSYVNAGHNPPLIKRNRKSFEYINDDPNIVIGIMEEMDYDNHEITLNPGDIIFLYTDGVTDANDKNQKFYGEDRLKQTLNLHKDERLGDIINAINRDMEDFCLNQEQFDDITMLIVKYTGGIK